MKRSTNIKLVFLLLIIFSLIACEEIKVYDEVPKITYQEFRYFDTTLIFDFIDGDGNLGLGQLDTAKPFNVGDAYYNNLFITYLKIENGKYSEIEFKFPPNYRFGIIPTPEGNNKTLDGTIEVKMKDNFPIPVPDSFFIQFYIVDRALNESNVDSTEILVSSEFHSIQ